jgi:serine/threonine protein kinase
MPAAVIIPIVILGGIVAIAAAAILVMYVLVPLFKGIGWLFGQVFRFVGGEVGDVLRVVGAIFTTIVFVPLTIGSIVVGRWSAAGHFGRAIQGEFVAIGGALYRIVVGHPARLFCLTPLTDGIERRLPQVVAAVPGADAPSKRRVGQFEGYTIVGSLPGGGSGGKLFVAEPDEIKRAGFERGGQTGVGQVVIKTFSLKDGSSLPQIVRESRALDAAKKLGLVLEHELTDERFYYVTRYVPGESLTLVTQRLHAASGPGGLGREQFRTGLSYIADLLRTLDIYHRGGLWHKDVKPDNIVVDRHAAHLVDFGLVSSLRSAMTLTTHGTEYFRDPEMVRMALKGVKVHEVNGAKFDVFGAGAVMFSVIENSFPAHGGLSQITQRCPEAVRWVVRRAMTDYDKRYASAGEMLADVEFVLQAADPFAVKPVDLPSMRGGAVGVAQSPAGQEGGWVMTPAASMPGVESPRMGSPVPPPIPASTVPRRRPALRLADWWSGRYEADRPDGVPTPEPARVVSEAIRAARRSMRSAGEQLEHARARMVAARERAHRRMSERRGRTRSAFSPGVNPGVGAAVFLFLVVCMGLVFLKVSRENDRLETVKTDARGDVAFSATRGVLPAPASASVLPASDAGNPPGPPSGDARFRAELKADRPPTRVTGRVLVLSDLQSPLPEGVSARITAALDRLRAAGLTLAGAFPGNTASGDELAAQIDMESRVRAARGLVPLDSADADRIIGEWLAAEPGLDLVAWWSPGDKGSNAPRFCVFGPRLDRASTPAEASRAADRQSAAVRAITGG